MTGILNTNADSASSKRHSGFLRGQPGEGKYGIYFTVGDQLSADG